MSTMNPVRSPLLDALTLSQQENLPGVVRQLHANNQLTDEARTLLMRENLDRLRRKERLGILDERALCQDKWFFEAEAAALGLGWEVDCMTHQTSRPEEGRKTPPVAYSARMQSPQVLRRLASWGAPSPPPADCLTAWHGLIDGVPARQKPSVTMMTLLGQLQVPMEDPVHPVLHRLALRFDTSKFAHPAAWVKALLKVGVTPETQTTTGDGVWHVLARAYEQRGNLHELETVVSLLSPSPEAMLTPNHRDETPLSLVTQPALLAVFRAVSAPAITLPRHRRLRS